MKRHLTLSMFIAAACGALLLAAPVITVDEGTYDFGEVLEGQFVTHVFALSNSGDEPLEIIQVRVTCGCTTTALPKSTLAPGESVPLEAQLDTAGYGSAITKTIYVNSNDPTTPRLVLKITGMVKQPERYHIGVGDFNYLFYLLVDLRSPDAYADAHLMGAINIPYGDLESWMPQLPKDVLIILYDQDGSTSDEAAQSLIEEGVPETKSLLGGFKEWTRVFSDKYVLAADGG